MNRRKVKGVYVVEFAIVGALLFVLLLGVVEFGRLMFTVNALSEAVRRGARLAAVCDIHDEVVLRRAAFADLGEGRIVGNLDAADLKLNYLDENGVQVPSPGTESGFSSIRFVEVRIPAFKIELFLPLELLDLMTDRDDFKGGFLTFDLEEFRAVLPRESLGRHAEKGVTPGITPC